MAAAIHTDGQMGERERWWKRNTWKEKREKVIHVPNPFRRELKASLAK